MTPVKLETGPLAPHSPGPVYELLFSSSTDMLVSTLLPHYVAFFRRSPIVLDHDSPGYYTCYLSTAASGCGVLLSISII